jgi:hypothetical protein
MDGHAIARPQHTPVPLLLLGAQCCSPPTAPGGLLSLVIEPSDACRTLAADGRR